MNNQLDKDFDLNIHEKKFMRLNKKLDLFYTHGNLLDIYFNKVYYNKKLYNHNNSILFKLYNNKKNDFIVKK